MISERTFATSFSGFWAELLPLLTPSFVHMMNEGYSKQVVGNSGTPARAVKKSPETRDFSLIAEFAFFLSKTSITKSVKVNRVFKNEELRASAESTAAARIRRFEARQDYSPPALTQVELNEGLKLALNYEQFFNQLGAGDTIEFSPRIPGAGFLASCEADISIGQTLFEVKTVDRKLASKDIRQLIVYFALQYATGDRRWMKGGFLNPRSAKYHEFEIDELISRVSGGRAVVDIFREIIDYVCTRDIQLDSAF